MTVPGHILDCYDTGAGGVKLAWLPFTTVTPDSYNVYVNGVLNQNVAGRLATVTGLQKTTYAAGVAVAPSGNSQRPQNMPPVGDVTPSGTYTFNVTAVKTGVEIASSPRRTITLQPTSIMLTTPMKRPFPFPATGMDGGGYGG
jgi:hypothetical protein